MVTGRKPAVDSASRYFDDTGKSDACIGSIFAFVLRVRERSLRSVRCNERSFRTFDRSEVSLSLKKTQYLAELSCLNGAGTEFGKMISILLKRIRRIIRFFICCFV